MRYEDYASAARGLYIAYAFIGLGLAIMLLGVGMAAIPTDKTNFFEIWINRVDVAPWIVGLVGGMIAAGAYGVRRVYLSRVWRFEDAVRQQVQAAQREGRPIGDDLRHVASKAAAFQRRRHGYRRLAFAIGSVFFVVSIAFFAWLGWIAHEKGEDPILGLVMAGFFGLGFIRLILERPRPLR
ncbi:hypothetical protein K1T73_11845 [Roseovarius sp. SCSIO 43702]|uniref:hypothetical protein n=1 Tax=Roseovarius sp. SCSIO 43702 TaxID=2823043 RepID=UPI001C72D98D|nr:hypothetical protein [Roseovarius sp. SCSIO 43702]QYX55772.1 hypothetical protein K1T73_11845 [Roseovarius sp. SCSIO 43702]